MPNYYRGALLPVTICTIKNLEGCTVRNIFKNENRKTRDKSLYERKEANNPHE